MFNKRVTEPIFYLKYVGMEDAVKEMERMEYPHFVVWLPDVQAFSVRHPLDTPLYHNEMIVAMTVQSAELTHYRKGLCPKDLVP